MKKLLLSVFALSAASVGYAQWTEQAIGFDAADRTPIQINIVDANTVWCVGYDGAAITPEHPAAENIQEITMTTNGGSTWTPHVIDLGDALLAINNLQGIDGTTAWLSSIDGNAGGGSLFKSEDGGENFSFANPPGTFIYSGATTASFQNYVHFFTPLIGIVSGDPTGAGNGTWETYRTTDGGTTWSAKLPAANYTGGAVGSGEFGYNGGNVAAGQFFWFVTSTGNIYRTANQGLNWTKMASPCLDFGGVNTDTSAGRIHFTDIDGDITHAKGILIATTDDGASYTRYTSTNGGTSWSAGTPYTVAYQTMDFIPGSDVLVAVGNNGAAYTSAYSTNLGQDWIEIDTDVQRTSIAFLNGVTGWAGSFSQDSSTGGIYKYTGAALGIPTVGPRPQFSATPNPTNGFMQVSSEATNISDVAVYDLLGKQVYSKKFSAVNQAEVDMSSLTTGSYVLKVTADTGATQTIKIVKN